jgi:hypothetical protein
MLISRTRVMIVALMSLLAISGGIATTASASWFIKGTKLASGATVALAKTAEVDESTILNAPSLGVRVTCTGGANHNVTVKGGFLQGEASGGVEELTFEGCSEIAPSTCTIQTTIKTEPIVFSAEDGTAPLVRIHFLPRTGKAFATLVFKGSCAEAGEQGVDGGTLWHSPEGQIGKTSQVLLPLGTTENNSLELLEKKAYLEGGKTLFLIASGLPWSFQ